MVKLYCIAALAVLPLYVAAAPAAEAPPTQASRKPVAAALPLAFDYLTREMDARLLAPAKGKAPRLDLPSGVTYTPAHQDALRTFFGTEQPLDIRRLPGKGPATNYSMAIPAHHIAEGELRYSWQAISGKLSIDRKGQIASSVSWPGMELAGKDGAVIMQGMRINGVRQRNLLTGKSLVEIDRLAFNTPDNVAAAVLHNVKGASNITLEGKQLNVSMDMGVRQVAAGGETIDDLHFAMRVRRLDQDTVAAMRTMVESIRNSNNGGDAGMETARAMALIVDFKQLFQRLVLRGATIDIDDISAVYRGNKAALAFSLGMPGAVAADFDSVERVVQKLAVRMHVRIPLPMLRDFATLAAQRSNQGKDQPEVPTAQLADQIYNVMLGKAVGGNFAKVDKNMLVSTIELKGGNLFVNAQALPIEPLLALLKGPVVKLPPPDTSAPVEVGMEDRGLEAARLFAMNGNSEGLYEMCRRHIEGRGVAKDHAEALKWCTKGSDRGVFRNKVLLATLYLDGDAAVRDYAAALKLLLPLAGNKHEAGAQYLLFRIYNEGLGTAKDPQQALAYLRLAAKGGNSEAVKAIKTLDATFDAPDPNGIEQPDPWTVIANAAGGHYLMWTYRFDITRHRRLRLTFGGFKDDDEWSPVQSLCLSAVKPSDMACLKLVRSRDDSGNSYFAVFSEVFSTDGQTRRGETVLPTRFKEGDTLDVRVYASGDKAYFLVNNEKPLVQSIDFPAELIRAVCSTGACTFRFEQAPATPAGAASPAGG
ncbi:MAG: DUF945 family protein [Burkholderiaceae bacterium]|nr:DUF945 family protein [Burkholderiaceae bacterium]